MASEGGLLGVLLPHLAQEWEARKAQTFNEVAGARAQDTGIRGRDPFKPIDIPSTKERKLSNQKKKRSKIATKGLRENQIRDFTSKLVGGK